jgi:hypothetical protein
MNDPLKRRMFRQPMNPNQAMGILASSPELMGAVQQRFANGGEVKNYQNGGASFLDRMFPRYADSPLAKGIEFLAGEKFKKGGEGETLANIAQQSLQSQVSPVIPGVNQTAVNPNPFEVNRLQTVFTPEKTNIGVDGEVTTSGNIEKQLKEADDKNKGVIDFEDQPTRVFEDIDPRAINDQTKKALEKEAKDKPKDEPKEKADPLLKGTEFKELKDAKAKLQEIQNNINKPNPGAPIVSEFKGALDKVQEELNKKQKELTVDEVDKLARRYAGLEDNASYDDDKHTAFWLSLIKGGLAIAGGESSNALTNIAKGLTIGVDAYGKDLARINAQERQDRKDLAEARYKVVKDAEDKFLALRTAKVQYLQNKAQLLQSSEQFKESLEFKKTQAANENAFRAATFEVNLFKTIKDIEIAGETLELKKETLAQDKELREKTLDLTIKQIESRENLAVLGEDAKRILAMGEEYATFKDGKFKISDDGRELLETYLMSKTTGKLTDLMQTVKDAKESLSVGGVKFKDAKTAKTAAFLYYKGGYADRIGKAKADVTSGKSEADIINEIKDEFAKASGGTFGDQTPADGSNAIVLD